MSTKKRTQSNISQFFVKKPNNSENVPPYNEPNSSKRQKLSNSLVEKEKDSIDRSRPPNDLLRLEYKFLGPGWVEALQKDLNSPTFKKLKEFLKSEEKAGYTIFPPKELIYSWSKSPIDDVKCCIIGQDPYHGVGQAHGLAFSVKHGVRVPPSLQNIYKEIKIEYPDFVPPKHGNLERLCLENGILLLNSTLTVRKDTPGSHGNKGWEEFTTRVLQVLAQRHSANGIVFFCWGAWAKKMLTNAKIDPKKHLVLSSVHPSPLSASRGFFNTGHFRKADEWLKEKYGKGIDWMVQSADREDKPTIPRDTNANKQEEVKKNEESIMNNKEDSQKSEKDVVDKTINEESKTTINENDVKKTAESTKEEIIVEKGVEEGKQGNEKNEDEVKDVESNKNDNKNKN